MNHKKMITCYFENNSKAIHGLRHISVNAIIVKDCHVLLGKRGTSQGKTMLETGKWGLIGGFMDRDETLTESIRREVREEAGCDIDNILLFRINDNPDRPREDRQNVDIVFIADFVSQIPVHDEEVSRLVWFTLDDLPPMEEIAFDHGENLMLYKKYREKSHPLPLLG